VSETITITKLETSAWLLWGLTGSIAGALSFEDSRLTYTAYGQGTLSAKSIRKLGELCGEPDLGQRLEAEVNGVRLFDEPREALEFAFPWYTFGGGMTVTTKSGRFRFSFLRPANTMAQPAAGLGAGRNILEGREAGRRWRQLVDAGHGAAG